VSEQSSTDSKRGLIWISAHIVGRPRNGRRSRHTTQPENRNAANVSAQSHPVDQQGVNRWTADAGHRNKKERSQFVAIQTRVSERACNRFFAQIFGRANPVMVGLSPGFHLQIFFFGKGEESSVDTHVTVQTPQHLRVFDLLAPIILERSQQHLLGIVMFGKRARRAYNSHGCSIF